MKTMVIVYNIVVIVAPTLPQGGLVGLLNFSWTVFERDFKAESRTFVNIQLVPKSTSPYILLRLQFDVFV